MIDEIPRTLVVGNWKMNGVTVSLDQVDGVVEGLANFMNAEVDVAFCPPATLLAAMSARAAGTPLLTGGQDCHADEAGAHTGDISAAMLSDAGAHFCIVGHSERRADHGESDALVRHKALAAIGAGLVAIICVGESAAERQAGKALDVVMGQLAASVPDDAAARDVVIAYEPVWAIGTGLVPSVDDVAEMHGAMRDALVKRFGEGGNGFRILYGGSVKADNAGDLLNVDNVDGALVGGASLKVIDFLGILATYRQG